jgi:phosphonopyruvate decarboxylase
MINTNQFLSFARKIGIEFFTGVPDSLLMEFSKYLDKNFGSENHIIAANEGGAIGLAIGYNLATSKVPLIYLQNSGFGNIINPIVSIADKNIFSIPMVLLIGWRGEPGFKDEPQHLKQGQITLKLLEDLDIPYFVLHKETREACKQLNKLYEIAHKNQKPVALVVKKDSFSPTKTIEKNSSLNYSLRFDVLNTILNLVENSDIIVSTTGKTSREIFQIKSENENIKNPCFYTIGGMGHCSQIALGISINNKQNKVFCIDGDGSFIMHLGSNAITANYGASKLYHIILNNESHESVGGQPTIANKLDFKNLSKGLGYREYKCLKSIKDIKDFFGDTDKIIGPILIEIKIEKGSSSSLGRPTKTPLEQKSDFISEIKQRF